MLISIFYDTQINETVTVFGSEQTTELAFGKGDRS